MYFLRFSKKGFSSRSLTRAGFTVVSTTEEDSEAGLFLEDYLISSNPGFTGDIDFDGSGLYVDDTLITTDESYTGDITF